MQIQANSRLTLKKQDHWVWLVEDKNLEIVSKYI